MTYATPEPVISGMPHRVLNVRGRDPEDLSDFVGEAEFVIDQEGVDYQVRGSGHQEGPVVRFHEKDVEHDGKDVRVWQIARSEGGDFTAEHTAAF